MRLYTVQPRFVYDILCRSGVFLSEPWKEAEEWICTDDPAVRVAYEWLCQAMAERGLRRPAPAVYPIWAWYQYMGEKKPKPDLRYSAIRGAARDARHVLLTLDVTAEDVLLHDYDAWHFPLNYLYLAPPRASARFERQCKAAGCPLYTVTPLEDEGLHAELQQSWQTIFDLSASRRLLKSSRADQAVQATFWRLDAADVTSVMEFGGGQRRRRLPLPGVSGQN